MRRTGSKLLLLSALIAAALAAGSAPAVALAQSDGPFTLYMPFVSLQIPPIWMGPYGGYVVVVTPDPTNGSVVYAGTWGAGVYKSIDGGVNWLPARGGLYNLKVNSMAVDPLNPQVVYAGSYGDGVFKSLDGGATWSKTSNGMQSGAVVYSIAVDPTNSSRVYAATRALGHSEPPWSGVLYKSSDGGASWTVALKDINGSGQQDWVYSIAIAPCDPRIILAAAHEYGVYRSLDFGATWAAANKGVSDLSGRALVFDPRCASPGTAYLGIWHRTGLFKTTNNGGQWRLITDGTVNAQVYSMGLAIDRLNPSRLFAATFSKGMLRSTNSGESWSTVGFSGIEVYSVAVNPGNSNVVYAGLVEQGLYRSTNGGSNWGVSHQGLSHIGVSSLVAIPGDSSTLYISTTGVKRTTSLGASWTPVGSGLPGDTVNQLVRHPDNPNLLFALTNSKGLYRIDLSASSSWTKLSAAPPVSEPLAEPHPLTQPDPLRELMPDEPEFQVEPAALPGGALNAMAFAPSNSLIAYLGSGGSGVYRSTNGGSSWSAAGLSGQTVWDVAVDPLDANKVYAATNTSGTVKYSANGGSSWGDTALAGAIPYALAFSYDDPTTVFAATSKGVYSRTGSGSWTLRGLSGLTVTAITAHPAHPGWVLAGTTVGAYYSPDGGNTWNAGPPGLEWLGIESIAVDPNNARYAYYCTSSSGVYRVALW